MQESILSQLRGGNILGKDKKNQERQEISALFQEESNNSQKILIENSDT